MFRQNKEVEIRQVGETLRVSEFNPVILSIMGLPEFLVERFSRCDQLVEEYLKVKERSRYSNRGQRRVNNRLASNLESQLKGLQRIATVLDNGYLPFDVPDGYDLGGVNERAFDLEFTAAIPPEADENFRRAKELKLFDELLVASPKGDHFKIYNGWMYGQPISSDLVVNEDSANGATRVILGGWARYEESERAYLSKVDVWGHTQIRQGIGFNIASWYLASPDQLKVNKPISIKT